MSIKFILTPDPDNPDRPCKPVEIIDELINSNRFQIALEAIYEETPEEAMFGEEIALPYCDPQKPYDKGLRAKGEVITMLSERLRERKKMALPGWPLRWHLLP